jgi:multiple sugar transport system permease protein
MSNRMGLFTILRFLALAGFLLLALFPLYWIVKISLTPDTLLYSEGTRLWPSAVSLENYRSVTTSSPFMLYLRNSVIVSASAALVSTFVAVGIGYALSRFAFRLRTAVMLGLLLTQLFPLVLIIAPLYRLLSPLGLTDNLVGLIIVYAAFNTPFAAFLMQSFFDAVPRELEEAGVMDGCSRLQALLYIVLPLTLPGLGVTAIFGFTAAWSELLLATMLISSESQKTFAIGLLSFITKFDVDWGQMTAAAVLALIPVCVFFGFVQKSLVAGLTAGALKG